MTNLWRNLQTDHSACHYWLPLSRTGDESPISFPLLPFLFHKNVSRQPIPQYVKGGDGSTCSGRRSAILCCSVALLSFLHFTHCRIQDATARIIPGIHIHLTIFHMSLPWCPTFSWKCARISLVVWWFFVTIVGCLNALAKMDSHGLPPTFSAPSLSVKALIYDNSADLRFSSSAQRHRIIFVNFFFEDIIYLNIMKHPAFSRSICQPWSLQCKQFKPQITEHKQVN